MSKNMSENMEQDSDKIKWKKLNEKNGEAKLWGVKLWEAKLWEAKLWGGQNYGGWNHIIKYVIKYNEII